VLLGQSPIYTRFVNHEVVLDPQSLICPLVHLEGQTVSQDEGWGRGNRGIRPPLLRGGFHFLNSISLEEETLEDTLLHGHMIIRRWSVSFS
jgi:hypothetical protein